MNTSTTHRLLVFVLALQALILLSIWTGESLPRAQAQVPDAGSQRLRQIEELKSLNDKMDKLLDVLTSGKLQVQVQTPEKK